MESNMNTIVKKLSSLVNYVVQSRTAKELLSMTDSRLTDIGLSRFKLEQGAAGYPWKLENNAVVLKFTAPKKSVPAAIVLSQSDNVAA
jgi:uncharacterized protein YjiS (DUF1127 family)